MASGPSLGRKRPGRAAITQRATTKIDVWSAVRNFKRLGYANRAKASGSANTAVRVNLRLKISRRRRSFPTRSSSNTGGRAPHQGIPMMSSSASISWRRARQDPIENFEEKPRMFWELQLEDCLVVNSALQASAAHEAFANVGMISPTRNWRLPHFVSKARASSSRDNIARRPST